MSIVITKEELNSFSHSLDEELGRTTALDEFIPLQNITQEKQVERIKSDHEHSNETYWEIENEHGHGWCCGYCGTVVQWG